MNSYDKGMSALHDQGEVIEVMEFEAQRLERLRDTFEKLQFTALFLLMLGIPYLVMVVSGR